MIKCDRKISTREAVCPFFVGWKPPEFLTWNLKMMFFSKFGSSPNSKGADFHERGVLYLKKD